VGQDASLATMELGRLVYLVPNPDLSPRLRGGGLPSVTKAKGYGKVGASEDAVEVIRSLANNV